MLVLLCDGDLVDSLTVATHYHMYVYNEWQLSNYQPDPPTHNKPNIYNYDELDVVNLIHQMAVQYSLNMGDMLL